MVIRIPGLHDFQREFLAERSPEQLFSGGAGIGKTEAGVIKLIDYAYRYPGSQTIYASATWSTMTQIFLPVVLNRLARFPPDEWTWQRGLRRFVFRNGSILHYRNLSNPASLRSMQVDFALLEEATWIPKIEEVFSEVQRALRGKKAPNAIAFITNPGLKTHWLYIRYLEAKTPGRWAVSLPAQASHLSPDYLARLDALPPTARQSFLLGEWGVRLGSAFPHLRCEELPELEATPGLARWSIAFDYGFSPDPMVYLLIAQHGSTVYVRRELTLYKVPTFRHRPLIEVWLNEFPVTGFTGETASGAAETTSLLKSLGLSYRFTDKHRQPGWGRLSDIALADQLVIHPDCPETAISLRALDWISSHGQTDVTGDYDHHGDALRYYVMSPLYPVAHARGRIRIT